VGWDEPRFAPNLPCHRPRHGFRIGAALVRKALGEIKAALVCFNLAL
jgi:hypothetical protein